MPAYPKVRQLAVDRALHRHPERLRAYLQLAIPATRAASRAERFGKCAFPNCRVVGTREHPLELHHVEPRSQSPGRRDDFRNHLYLCGDFHDRDHHGGLHGEQVPGRHDWERIGVRGAAGVSA